MRNFRYRAAAFRPINKIVTRLFGIGQSKRCRFYRITRYVRIYGGVDIFDIIFDNFPYCGDRNVAVAACGDLGNILAALGPFDEGVSRLSGRNKRYRFVLYRVACRIGVDGRIDVVRARYARVGYRVYDYVPISRYSLVTVAALRYLRYGDSVFRPIYKVISRLFGIGQSKRFRLYSVACRVGINGSVDIFDVIFDNLPYRGNRNVAVASLCNLRDILAALGPFDKGVSRLSGRNKRYRFVLYRVACRIGVDGRIDVVRARYARVGYRVYDYVPISRYSLVTVAALRYLRYGDSVFRPIYKVISRLFGIGQSKRFRLYSVACRVGINGSVDIFDVIFDNLPYRGNRNVAVASLCNLRDILAALGPFDKGVSRLSGRNKRYRFVLYRVTCRVRVDGGIHVVLARDIIYNLIYNRRIDGVYSYVTRDKRIIFPCRRVACFGGDRRFGYRHRFHVKGYIRHFYAVCNKRSRVADKLPHG